MLPKSLVLSFVGSLLVTFTGWAAGTSALEGIVKDPTGRPIKGADVRIEAKNFSQIVKTDARGHYVSDSLAVGTYKVTLVINGQVKASILNAKTQLGRPTQLNFDFTAKTTSAKKHTHSVWCPTATGTLIGGSGQWVEVDDNGTIVSNTGIGINSVEKVSGSALQTRTAMPNPAKFGGQ